MELKKLILKLVLFCTLLASTYFFAQWQLSKGQIDYFYSKFTHQSGSLVLGISRSNDGISPSVIERNFGQNEIDHPVLNFAFAQDISNYGPVYLDAIKKKVLPGTKNGLFILEVNPGSLSISIKKVDSVSTLYDDQTILSLMKHFNQHPNFEYIRKFYTHSLYKSFQPHRRIDIIRYAHTDGWQEVLKGNGDYVVSEKEVNTWKKMKIDEAYGMIAHYKPSKARLECLEKTINYLKDFGQVFLVRVPISPEFVELEQLYWPEFSNDMKKIAIKNGIIYLDYMLDGDKYDTYDGSHLFGESAKVFTQKLCDDIRNYRMHKNN